MKNKASRRSKKLVGWIFFLVLLAAGLLCGTESTLVLSRERDGAVIAVNAWRFLGALPLVWRKAEDVRDARLQEVELTQQQARSSAYRNAWGMLTRQEELVIVGTTEFSYPYHEDLSLIRAFLANPSNRRVELRHPIDIRRKVASVVLLALIALSVVGWVWKKAVGRRVFDPKRVKPLPPAIGTAVFLFAIVVAFWFFQAGHLVVGPLATSKVDLLLNAAKNDDASGVAAATSSGVFLDARDGQSRTALMTAAAVGARQAVEALLKAGAHPNLRDLEDRTALTIAISARHAEVAMDLLDAGADVEAADTNGRTAIHLAADERDPSLLKRLIGLGADVNRPDAHGWTPIFFAASGGSAESIRALLDAGADARKKLPDGRAPKDLSSDPAVGALLGTAAGIVEQPPAAPRASGP